MDYIKMHQLNKLKYLDLSDNNYQQIGGKKDKKILFILFGDVMTGHNVWFHDMNGKKIDFVKKLKKIGNVIILKPNYINFMKYSKKRNNGQIWFYKTNSTDINFNKEDLYFENYNEWVLGQIDRNKKYIAIGLDQGCHFAKYFCNQNPNNCVALYILNDRNFTKESYEKTFHSESTYDFIKSIVGDNYEKYITENLTDSTIHDLIEKIQNSENNEKYIELLNGLCKGVIRSQYNKITKMNVRTIIYSDATVLTPEKLKQNIEFSDKSNGNVIYFYFIDDSVYLIHGKYKNSIYDSIYGIVKNNENY